MRNRLFQLTLILVLVVALPIALFLARSANELSDNEKMVRKVFDVQLESILYSLNQHTEMLFGLWSSRLDMASHLDSQSVREVSDELLWKNQAIVAIALANRENGKRVFTAGQTGYPMVEKVKPDREMLLKLEEYRSAGYQKVASAGGSEGVLLYFLLSDTVSDFIGQIWINPEIFIDRNLSPIVQQVSQDLFQISVSRHDQSAILSSDTLLASVGQAVSEPSWYLPGYQFYIRLKSRTIDELVADRSRQNNFLLLLTLIVVVIGGGFVIYALRREMHLAALKADFVSNVSHELRTPLALVNMYSETLLLKRLKDPKREEEYLSVIHREAQRLSEMVGRILNFSRMERGQREYRLNDCEMNALVREVIGLYQPRFEQDQVSVSVENLPGRYFIRADREAVVETLVNLIDNAIHYGPDANKTIKISLSVHHQYLVVAVEDNGVGISPRDQRKIFDKFYRVTSGNLANKVKGTGLGLNIVRQIMLSHHGKVSVESFPGRGSCFRLFYPLKKE